MGEDRHHGHVQLVVHLVKILVIILIMIWIIILIIVVIVLVIIIVINQLDLILYLLSIHTNLTVSVAKLKSSYSREIFLRFFLITTQKPSSR